MTTSLIFLGKSFLGNLYRHLATFYWSHCMTMPSSYQRCTDTRECSVVCLGHETVPRKPRFCQIAGGGKSFKSNYNCNYIFIQFWKCEQVKLKSSSRYVRKDEKRYLKLATKLLIYVRMRLAFCSSLYLPTYLPTYIWRYPPWEGKQIFLCY